MIAIRPNLQFSWFVRLCKMNSPSSYQSRDIFETKPESIYPLNGGLTTTTHYGFFRPHPQSLTDVRKALFTSERNRVPGGTPLYGIYPVCATSGCGPKGIEVWFWVIFDWKRYRFWAFWSELAYIFYPGLVLDILFPRKLLFKNAKQYNPSQMFK